MAVDAFIWFESQSGMADVKGETLDQLYGGQDNDIKGTHSLASKNGAFEIKDFSFGVENPTTIGSATGGAGAGKIKFNEFTIKKTSDSASPAFFKNCCAGSHYKTVYIDMRKAGGDPNSTGKAFLRFRFETVFCTKIDWSGPGDEGPEESITFVYGILGVAYWPQKAAGVQGAVPKAAGWNQMLNISQDANLPGPQA